MKTLASILIASITLWAGCSTGPNSEEMKLEIQKKLDQQLGENASEITDITRRGSYSYSKDAPMLLVYYKSKIRFLKELRLSGSSAGSLIASLGATSAGIKGVLGSKIDVGQNILVYGTLNYRKENGKWISAAPFQSQVQSQVKSQVQSKAKTEATETKAKYVPEIDENERVRADTNPLSRDVEEIGKLTRFLMQNREEERAYELHRLVRGSINRFHLKLAKWSNWNVLVTGTRSGSYFQLGSLLADRDPSLRNLETSGSLENARLVGSGRALFGLVQSDILTDTYEKSHPSLRAITSLFPEAVQIVVSTQTELPIRTLADLRGKRVNLGLKRSGTLANAKLVLQAAHLPESRLKKAHYKSPEWAAAQLEVGKIDAFFFTSAIPSALIQNLISNGKAQLLAIGPSIRRTLLGSGSMTETTISQKTYDGLKKPIQTVGVSAVLVTHKDASEATVTELTKLVFDHQAEMSKKFIPAHSIQKKDFRSAVSVPHHPAALKVLSRTN